MLGMLAAVTRPGPWVAGVLANTMWAGSEEPRVNPQALHPLVKDNMAGGPLFSWRPVMTADGSFHGSDRWMAPVGGGIGRVFKDGDQPLTPRGQLFNNVVRHAGAASRILQVQLRLPTT